MAYNGINLANVKLINRSGILKLLNDNGSLSRKDIAEQLGLTPAAVTQICNELIEKEVIREVGTAEEDEKRSGRKKVLLEINALYSHVISVSIEEQETCVSLCDLQGECMASVKFNTSTIQEPEDFLSFIAGEINSLVEKLKISKEKILGIGVSIPGSVDREKGISILANRIWEREVHVSERLTSLTGFSCVTDNNIAAFSEAELLYGSGKTTQSLLFIKWGPGVGAAFANSNLFGISETSRIIEIGHVISKKNGSLCRCGKRGCLEMSINTHAVAEKIRSMCESGKCRAVLEWANRNVQNIRAGNLSEWINLCDEEAMTALEPMIGELSLTAVNTYTLFKPDNIVLYGKMFAFPAVKERFVKLCHDFDSSLNWSIIKESELAKKAQFIGGAAVAVNAFFINRK